MAPANGASKLRKGVARPIVPVLPLSMEKRRPASTSEIHNAPAPSREQQSIGSSDNLAKEAIGSGLVEVTAAEAAPLVDAPLANGTTNAGTAPGHVADAPVVPTQQPVDHNGTTSVRDTISQEPSVAPTSGHRQKLSTDSRGATNVTEMRSRYNREERQKVNSSASRRNVAVSSPTHHQMPSFEHAHRFAGHPRHIDNNRVGRPPTHNGPPHMHHPALSNGSLQFGGFHDSNNSSPAPPLSGGIAPPPGHPLGPPPGLALENHGAFADRGVANGFPPSLMPYGREFVPDNFGRPPMMMSPMDANYPPYNNFGPSTPHSFQGSQSSAPNDESVGFGPYPGPDQNGNAPREEARMHHHVPPPFALHGAPQIMHAPPPHHVLPPVMDPAGGSSLLHYIKDQFGDATFADCTLELRYLDDRAAPVRIPGHRFMFARSPALAAQLQSSSPSSSPHGLGQRTILLQSDDRYVRSESFWMAVQNLYGWPLLPLDSPRGNEMGDFASAANRADRFDFALGYVAAGHLLQWEPVVGCGIEIAKKYLNWETIEKALAFILGAVDGRGISNAQTRLPYGQAAHFLMASIVSFIINNFPPNFAIDRSVVDTDMYARLPVVPSLPVTKNGPTIVRGTSVNHGPGHRPKLSHIKFGDLAGPAGDANGHGSATGPSQPPPAWNAILSRVLINLPFAFLRPILESGGPGSISAWANAEARHRVIKEVIAERELRRTRALAAVKAGRVPNLMDVQFRLSSQEPQAGSTEWDVLGFKEEVAAFGNGDTPTLIQKWVPLVVENSPQDSSTQAPTTNASTYL